MYIYWKKDVRTFIGKDVCPYIGKDVRTYILEWRLLQVMALMILDPYSVFSHNFTGYICERSKIALIWMVLIWCKIYGCKCFASFFIQKNYTYLPSQGDIQSIQPTTHPLYYGATYIQDGIFCGFCVLTDLLFMEKVAGVKILCYINVFTVMKTNILGTVEIG